MRRAVVLLVACLAVRAAVAGEQLSVEELTRRASAVVVLGRTMPSMGKEERQVIEWLKGDASAAPDLSSWGSLCVPSREVLGRWLEGHPRHPGRDTWKKILADGETRQIVFLAARDGGLAPLCETEVMLGTGFSAHPDFEPTRTRILALVASERAAAAFATTSSLPAGKVPASSAGEQAAAAATSSRSSVLPGSKNPTPAADVPSPGAGCW